MVIFFFNCLILAVIRANNPNDRLQLPFQCVCVQVLCFQFFFHTGFIISVGKCQTKFIISLNESIVLCRCTSFRFIHAIQKSHLTLECDFVKQHSFVAVSHRNWHLNVIKLWKEIYAFGREFVMCNVTLLLLLKGERSKKWIWTVLFRVVGNYYIVCAVRNRVHRHNPRCKYSSAF